MLKHKDFSKMKGLKRSKVLGIINKFNEEFKTKVNKLE